MRKKKNEAIIQRLKQELTDLEVMKRFRVKATDFTRVRAGVELAGSHSVDVARAEGVVAECGE